MKEEREKMNILNLFVTTVGKGHWTLQVIGVFMESKMENNLLYQVV
jgi:hypothetical protein